MKLISFVLGAFLVFAAVPGAFGFVYGPYDGTQGYQEIQVARDVYLVAFHGEKGANGNDVYVARRTRMSELCLSVGAEQFVELKYSFEPVMLNDPPLLIARSEGYGASIMKARLIIIPIIIPGMARRPPSIYYYSSPSDQAHVRCIQPEDLSKMLDPGRLVEVRKMLDEARSRGWISATPLSQDGRTLGAGGSDAK